VSAPEALRVVPEVAEAPRELPRRIAQGVAGAQWISGSGTVPPCSRKSWNRRP
jgi:hypothetical protein